MRLKKRKNNKLKTITFRVTEKEYNKIKLKAGLYTDRNISEWVGSAALNYRPDKSDIE